MSSERILIVNASPSDPSRTATLCDHVALELDQLGLPSHRLTLRDLPSEPLVHCLPDAAGVREAVSTVAAAKAIVLVTPIYKAAYSGLLKIFLDLLPQFALTDKVVLPLATAGSPAHVLALDYALRPVLASLGVRHADAGFVVLERQLEIGAAGPRLDDDAKLKMQAILSGFADSVRRHA